MQQNSIKTQFICCMPKIELHIHLEGTIQPQRALSLIRRYDPGSSLQTVEDIKNQYRFGNLPDFLRAMQSISDYLRSPEDLHNVALDMLRDLSRQNVLYVEFDCAFHKYMRLGFSVREIVDALKSAINQVNSETGIGAGIVLNIVRRSGDDGAIESVKAIIDLADDIVVGIGLSGDETKFPPELYKEAFSLAQQNGLGVTVHAGEGSGPESVWHALKTLGAHRIDHGTRAKDDPLLVEYLVKHQIPLTMCPTSNILLNVVSTYSEHPLRYYFDRGIPVNINSDDPAIFNTSVTRELLICSEIFNFSISELERLMVNAIQATFRPLPEKVDMENRVQEGFKELQVELRISDLVRN